MEEVGAGGSDRGLDGLWLHCMKQELQVVTYLKVDKYGEKK